MKAAVRYQSRSGNTKKVAEAIAEAVNTAAETAETALTEKADILFLGGALYAGKPDKALVQFIQSLTADQAAAVAVFSTSASGRSIYQSVKDMLKDKDIIVFEENFVCPGKFLFKGRSRPDSSDLMQAGAFAKKLLENVSE